MEEKEEPNKLSSNKFDVVISPMQGNAKESPSMSTVDEQVEFTHHDSNQVNNEAQQALATDHFDTEYEVMASDTGISEIGSNLHITNNVQTGHNETESEDVVSDRDNSEICSDMHSAGNIEGEDDKDAECEDTVSDKDNLEISSDIHSASNVEAEDHKDTACEDTMSNGNNSELSSNIHNTDNVEVQEQDNSMDGGVVINSGNLENNNKATERKDNESVLTTILSDNTVNKESKENVTANEKIASVKSVLPEDDKAEMSVFDCIDDNMTKDNAEQSLINEDDDVEMHIKATTIVNCDNSCDEDNKEPDCVEITEDPIAYDESSTDKDTLSKDISKQSNSITEDDSSHGNVKEITDEVYIVRITAKEMLKLCMICNEIKLTKYDVTYDEVMTYLCSNMCLDTLKESNSGSVITSTAGEKQLSAEDDVDIIDVTDFQRRCFQCKKEVGSEIFAWETKDFCSKLCLAKYQRKIGGQCAQCSKTVTSNLLGKYCVRFGCILRQFCCSSCLESYKKTLKVCAYCQEDMSTNKNDTISKIIKGQKRDFCSAKCCNKYSTINQKRPKADGLCRVCQEKKRIEVEYFHENEVVKFCSEPCFVAYKFVNKINAGVCHMCHKYLNKSVLRQHAMFYDNELCFFCSKTCQNIYTIVHRRIIQCSWCKVKKYNFDMIQTTLRTGEALTLCCLNCLSFFEVSDTAINSRNIVCDNCSIVTKSLYHLTMSDASIRNFCSYKCVMTFQTQFPKKPITLPNQILLSEKGKSYKRKRVDTSYKLPIITSVVSLAENAQMENDSQNSTDLENDALKKLLIIKNAPSPSQRNVSTMAKPVVKVADCGIKPDVVDKECQTDIPETKPILIPIPSPIYIPSPMTTFRVPFIIPLPFPLPVQIPIFVPITKTTSNNILKDIKKVEVKGPSDPFEAELLMMAELVATNNKKEESSVETDEGGIADETGDSSPEPMDGGTAFGDDVLQMAFNMPSDYEEPAVDLEGALTASTITATQGSNENANESVPLTTPQPDRTIRQRRKYNRSRSSSKRGRRPYSTGEIQEVTQGTPSPPPAEPIEKPDAHMCLKYTFGVNAWKQWVTTKNVELEKCSRRPKLFKTEILQLTADELNYSLCLFVKEVRKPNGAEYAPDTIFYLCLGIQQYLYENGRIDNIFCDTYYEKFTDCLDEVCKKFSALYNESHYIVTRVEEEHLWESKQLGAHSPHVLLSTLMFFNTKHFNLTSVDEHMQLSFSHIMKHWKRNPTQTGGTVKSTVFRNVLLRFYPPQTTIEANNKKRRVYEQQENEDNPLRCPVKLYEFYLSKCPESVKTRNDVFYLLPERSCVPDSPVWYSTSALGKNALEKMLHRVKMVKEVNVAVLTA